MAKRILLADDSITIQKVVELTFSDGDYDVTAVNNGTKAIQKLSEMRPDIILSDIIMPEKNGYEVCEYVKSHPEFRNIPVILLTGTFEPFDPDRADKAGCDAVVTKPFESQSLIHKVEELIEHAKTQVPTSPGMPSPFAKGESPFAPEPTATPSPPSAPPASQFATGTFDTQGEVFGGGGEVPSSPSPSPPTSEMPFEQPPAAGGETRAFPKLSFEELKSMAAETPTAPMPSEPETPWAEPPLTGGETRAFPKMTFDDLEKTAPVPPAEARPSSPWDEEVKEPAAPAPPAPPPSVPETPSWISAPSPTPPLTSSTPSLWDEHPSEMAGETKAFPRMSFDELEKMTPPPEKTEPMEALKSEPTPSAAPATGELSDEQIDRIARRVVQLMSEQVVRNIAWEVIPDLAEMVVKERIRQLESE